MNRREFLANTVKSAAAVYAAANLTAHADNAASKNRWRRSEFSFLHTYESTGRYWRGIKKAGLIRPATGVRLVNSPFGEDEYRFNAIARKDGPLYRILSERRCKFIVDRVVGGSPYCVYDFDKSLIADYAAMLGENLLGGQVHEVISNVHNDWGRFKKAMGEKAGQPVDPAAVKSYLDWSSADHWLEYGTVADYAGRVAPENDAQYWAEIERAARRQGKRFGGHFSYCEGTGYGELVWSRFYKFGAAYCLVEVGPWASKNSQFAIACARGSAKAADKPWGIFYAPWGPDGCTSYIQAADWSWRASRESLDASGWPVGPDKGPSTALQRRIFFHAYMSGAHTLHEEWGAEGNLLGWPPLDPQIIVTEDSHVFRLSPYGKVTKELLDFQDSVNVGEPCVPVALILDTSVWPPDPAPWAELKKRLYACDEEDKRCEARPDGGKEEAVCYSPSALPEMFDIVPSDAPESVLNSYPARIPVNSQPSGDAWAKLDEAVRQYCPFEWTLHLPIQVNRCEGAWIIALFNPWGAKRNNGFGIGSELDNACTMFEHLKFKAPVKSMNVLYRWPAASEAELHENRVYVTVGPGGLVILKVVQ